MHAERVRADDEEADVIGGECAQQIEEVLIHRGIAAETPLGLAQLPDLQDPFIDRNAAQNRASS